MASLGGSDRFSGCNSVRVPDLPLKPAPLPSIMVHSFGPFQVHSQPKTAFKNITAYTNKYGNDADSTVRGTLYTLAYLCSDNDTILSLCPYNRHNQL